MAKKIMSKIIAVASQKGGVSKSTTCRNVATILAKEGYKVLAIDTDNQASMTDCFGIEKPEKLQTTLYHLMMNVMNEKDLPPKESYIIHRDGVDIIPSSIELSAIEMNLVSTMSREYVLKTIIEEVKGDYDYVILDSAPSLGLMTLNVLAACNSVLIPATPEYLSVKGLELLLHTIMKLKRRINPGISFEGILLTMFDERTNLSKSMIEMVDEAYGEHIRVFDIKIPKSVKVGEANLQSKSIVDYMPSNKAAIAYQELTKELINNGQS
jgi:chromosome partitioning protein